MKHMDGMRGERGDSKAAPQRVSGTCPTSGPSAPCCTSRPSSFLVTPTHLGTGRPAMPAVSFLSPITCQRAQHPHHPARSPPEGSCAQRPAVSAISVLQKAQVVVRLGAVEVHDERLGAQG